MIVLIGFLGIVAPQILQVNCILDSRTKYNEFELFVKDLVWCFIY